MESEYGSAGLGVGIEKQKPYPINISGNVLPRVFSVGLYRLPLYLCYNEGAVAIPVDISGAFLLFLVPTPRKKLQFPELCLGSHHIYHIDSAELCEGLVP